MEASSTWTYCARPIRFLFVALTTLVLFAACSEPQVEAPEVPSEYLAMRKSDIVYGPVNTANPFEHVGQRHNDLVHAVIGSLHAWDTLDSSHMLGRIQTSGGAWAQEEYDLSADRSMELVQAAFAMKIDSSAPQRLAAYESASLTAREEAYLHRIGELLCEENRFDDVEAGLLDIERDILAESWPAGDSTETAARIAISVAKHSFAYWKRMMCTVYGIEDGSVSAGTATVSGTPGGSLGKTATDVIVEATSRSEIVMAADVIGAIAAGQNAQPLGPLAMLEAAVITGGTLSLTVAVLVYWPEIKTFAKKLLPWNW